MPVEHTPCLRRVSSNLGILQEQSESIVSPLRCGLFLLALQFFACTLLFEILCSRIALLHRTQYDYTQKSNFRRDVLHRKKKKKKKKQIV